ncbi:polysaccharide biosynthesis protein CapD [Deinococcus arenae]|uniref:Polysaccharide biosynthesis protein CapD n=1 Tax=Deinococcus arenae TaxID=1452751 RepID=A0A8H9GLW6_9DEIO|nr:MULTISPECIES: nucleoside-diphosphate sugar epimerase/dehydratase [Deinococcus]AWT37815.1 polysaccharide biosynthesis protein [Deinococcus actinosclerus]GGM37963.1 polysaccharide biosynthesis protein CapD [Deinococcus arenae]
MHRTWKFTLDLLVWSLAGYVAFVVRLENLRGGDAAALLGYLGAGLAVKAAVIAGAGFARQHWPRVGLRDLRQLARGVALGTAAMLALALLLPQVPDTVPLLDGLLALLGLGGLRALARLRAEERTRPATSPARRILVAGAGEAGSIVVREMQRHPSQGMLPVGFVDDDPHKQGSVHCGVPVLGTVEQLAAVAERAGAAELIIAMPSADGHQIRRVVNQARAAGLAHRIIPGMYELLSGEVTIAQIRDVNLEDVLRRKPVRLNVEEISSYLQGSTVMVTGAGGSIGSEIVRQIVHFQPRRVILFGRGENSIFSIQQELNRLWPDIDHVEIIGDVRHATHLRTVFERFRPDVVIHAAAHKHVPLMEDSPSEALYNNVLGTRTVVSLALEYGVKRFVNISTDKAVRPTSVMGSTKRLAEMVVACAAQHAGPDQAFVSVRFGNVLGSRGSVVPTFMAQIRAGGPVTVTHPDMTRYFMLIPEAARLVLEAAGLAQNGRVYVLKMGAPVRIVDLANDVIRLSGAKGIDVVFSGIRPGEKLTEELLTNEESLEATTNGEIFVVKPNDPAPDFMTSQLKRFEELARNEEYGPLRQMMRDLIPESLMQIHAEPTTA